MTATGLTRWQSTRNRVLIWWRKIWYRGDPVHARWVSTWQRCTACEYETVAVYPVVGNVRRLSWECPRCLKMAMRDTEPIHMPEGAP